MRAFLLLALTACDPTGSGTSIGNPNKTLLRLAPAGSEVQLSAASAVVVGLLVDGVELEVPADTDVLTGIELALPPGTASRIEVEFAGTLDLLGTEGQATVDLALAVPSVAVAVTRGELTLDQPHVFELAEPDWLDARNTGWQRGDPHVIRPGDPLHDPLAEAVETGSALWLDLDEDGQPDR
jgi:hypothetical protein